MECYYINEYLKSILLNFDTKLKPNDCITANKYYILDIIIKNI